MLPRCKSWKQTLAQFLVRESKEPGTTSSPTSHGSTPHRVMENRASGARQGDQEKALDRCKSGV